MFRLNTNELDMKDYRRGNAYHDQVLTYRKSDI